MTDTSIIYYINTYIQPKETHTHWKEIREDIKGKQTKIVASGEFQSFGGSSDESGYIEEVRQRIEDAG